MLAEVFETYTYKDYEKWGGDWELIRGIAYAMSPFAIVSHQKVGDFNKEKFEFDLECKTAIDFSKVFK